MKKIESDKAPQAVGPYSQAIDAGDFVYLSGQLGIDRQTGRMAEGIEGQTQQAFINISYVLEEAGLTLDNVVKVLVLLNDIKDFAKVNEIYAQKFSEPFPARSAFAVAALPLGGLVEIEVIAKK
ncbi:RidA family protein [Eremococcus coleocola]|uniref:Putative endoribonuclease L-PSP n=1 Tax=Eremococcus coleocola ACS-139-V-Col8 TaxID=908337 RepID=E4KMV1_9LACT|nr:putative endoribonuclease L-PSP [Eremococcus coleocola ACS-139-V-Col8]